MAIVRKDFRGYHTYYIDGRRADGVTTLISRGWPKDLTDWSARCVAEYVADNPGGVDELRKLGRDPMVDALKGLHRAKSGAGKARGTDVHTFAEKLLTGEPVDVPEHLAGYVDACARFLDDWNIPPHALSEVVIAHREHNYAGTVDLIHGGIVGGGRLFDYKTTSSGIWPETALQLTAYKHAQVFLNAHGDEGPMGHLHVERTFAVWLQPDDYAVMEVESGPEVFEHFLAAAKVARALVKKGGAAASWIHEEAAA